MKGLYYTPLLLLTLLLLNNCKEVEVECRYIVAFDSNGGSDIATQVVEKGQKAIQPVDPTRTGYIFAGWYADSDFQQPFDFNIVITASITLYAKWNRIMNMVVFNTGGGSPVPSQYVEKGQKITQPVDPTRMGYTFVGWYVGSDFQQAFDINTVITSDTTLYAKWDRIKYTVTFSSGWISTAMPQHIDSAQMATKPSDPKRLGYLFAGWYADSGFRQAFDFNTPITANITLYAKWDRIVYTVTFNSGEGTPVLSQQIDSAQKVSKPGDPKRMAYTFGGWYADSGFQQLFDFANTPITANITLYAKWDEGYIVTFDSGVGTTISPVTVAKGGILNVPTLPTSGKFTLMAWYTEPAFINIFNFSSTINSNTILYAKYGFKVPDGNFRNKLKALVPTAFIGDVMDTAHGAVTGLDTMIVHTSGIASLEGIEYFTALKKLTCSSNQLTGLDLSKNTLLKYLDCTFNHLTNLDVSANVALKDLKCYNNELVRLDISKNTALEALNCSYNELVRLDVSNNTALKVLKCYRNHITGFLDMSRNLSLELLSCFMNKMDSLDVSKNTALLYLSCYENQLISLDIRGISSASTLFINAGQGGNPLTVLKVLNTIKNHPEIKEVKVNRKTAVTITAYNNSDRTTVTCNNYDPNQGTCLD